MSETASFSSTDEARREASRAVRASLEQVIEVSFARCHRCVWCMVLLLSVGLIAGLTWAQLVYIGHMDDACDQPLAAMLRILFLIVMMQAMQSAIARHCLCYDWTTDGPVEPCRVRAFRTLSLLAAMAWPLVAGWMLFNSHKCSSELKSVVAVAIGYYATLVLVVFLLPVLVISTMLCLIRRGLLALPRMPGAAPEGAIDALPAVAFEAHRFNDEPNGLSSSCAVCLEAFNGRQAIVQTPCGHVFHRRCLGGWMQVARSCPLCRADVAVGP